VVELTASDAAAGGAFGSTVAIFGDTAVVGTSDRGQLADRPGSAYIFERDERGPDNWGQVKKLTASNPAVDDNFGTVAIFGDTVIVGAMLERVVGRSGAAYIFQRDQGGRGNWGEVVKLIPSDASPDDVFGWSVAISNDLAIVSAVNENDPVAGDQVFTGSGAAYVFGRDVGGANNWGEMLKITAPDATLEDFFGASVALSGNRALIGSVGHDNRGSLYLFELPAPGEPIEILRYPKALYTTADDGSASDFDGLGDAARDVMSKNRTSVGELDSSNANQVNRLVAKFVLPDVPQSMPALKSAILSFFLEDITGTPAGPTSLFHSTSDNDLDQLPSDFEDATYTDTNLDLVGPADEAGRYYELDVTDLVRADYAADGDNRLSAFRLQITDLLFSEDDQSARYRFTMPGADDNLPQLLLTFVPEPSTWLLAVIASLVLVGRFRPKGRERAGWVRVLIPGGFPCAQKES